ncbi:hypothetical protein D3C75_1234160 [compost metagenome]
MQAIEVVYVDPGVNQGAHGVDMPALGCRNQCGTAIPVGALEIGAVGQSQAQDLVETTCAGIQVRAVVDVVLGIDVSPGFDQHPRGV